MNRESREAIVSFTVSLVHGYPSCTVAQYMILMLAARRLRALPNDAANIVADLKRDAPQFEVVAADGILQVNIGPAPLPAWCAKWIEVTTR